MKEKNKKLIILVIVLLILLVGVGVYLYFKLDIFKTNRELFYKYLILENIDNINGFNISPYEKLKIKDKNHEFNGKIKLDSLNNELNLENELYLSVNSKSDISANKSSMSLAIKKGEESLLNVEYLVNSEKIGLKADDITEQKYITIENNNLKELASKLGVEDTSSIPEKIQFDSNIKDKKISIGRLKEIEKKYSDLLNSMIPDEKYSTDKNVSIEIDNKEKKVKKYSLTLTEKEIFDIIFKFLETLNEDVETQQFYIEYFDEDATIKETSDNLLALMNEFKETEEEYSETDNIVFSVYSYKGKNVKTEITAATGNSISLYLNNNRKNDQIKLEFFEIKNEEENVFVGSTTSLGINSKIENKNVKFDLYLTQKYNEEDKSTLEETEIALYENTSLECNVIFSDIASKSINVLGEGKYNENTIFNLEGQLNTDGTYEFIDFTEENSTLLNSYTDTELIEKVSSIGDKTINTILEKSEQVVPGSSIIVSTILSGYGVGSIGGYTTNIQSFIGDDVTAEVNNALAVCIDQYAYAYMFDNTVSLGDYLNEENVKNYCSGAKEITFTQTGIKYISTEGKVYEGIINDSLENGYVYVEEMIEK